MSMFTTLGMRANFFFFRQQAHDYVTCYVELIGKWKNHVYVYNFRQEVTLFSHHAGHLYSLPLLSTLM
jgi:hypothetical protein